MPTPDCLSLLPTDACAGPARPRRGARLAACLAALAIALLAPALASATTISALATPFIAGGVDVAVRLTVDDAADPGNLVLTLAVEHATNFGDLRALYLHVNDEDLLSGLSVTGAAVSQSIFGANSIYDLGPYDTTMGLSEESPCPCDLGIEIGQMGFVGDDYQSVSFVLSHDQVDLTLDLLASTTFGVRISHVVGLDSDPEKWEFTRNKQAAKLSGTLPIVPEPSTALLMLLGLGGLALGGSKR